MMAVRYVRRRQPEQMMLETHLQLSFAPQWTHVRESASASGPRWSASPRRCAARRS